MQGKLLVFTAPSGAGKTTLVRYLLSQLSNLAFSVSATTRPRRAHEVNGKDYYFISVEEFMQYIDKGCFLEWQEVYDGNYYGTLKNEIDRLLKNGKDVILDVDVSGALNIKKYYGDDCLSIFVKAPTIEHLKNRLKQRRTETEETIAKRMSKAVIELQYECHFDTTVLNDDVECAKKEALRVVKNFLNSNNTI